MVIVRQGHARALAAGILALVSACFSGGGGKHAAPPPPPGNAIVARGPDYSAAIADPLGFLPVDSEIVMGLDADAVRRSALWPPIAAKLGAAGGSQLTAFKAICGFDPMVTVHAVTLGIKNLKQPAPDGVIVVHGLDRPQLMQCMSKAQGKNDKTVAIEDGIVTITTKDPGQVVFAFVDASTIVSAIGPTANKAQLQAVLKAGSPLRSSPAFEQLIKLTDLEGALWGVVNGNSSVFEQMAGLGMRPKAVFGSVSLQTGLGMAMRLRLDSAAQAQQFQQMAMGQIGMVRSMFDKLDITTDDADLVLALQMSDAQLTSLLQLAGVSLGP